MFSFVKGRKTALYHIVCYFNYHLSLFDGGPEAINNLREYEVGLSLQNQTDGYQRRRIVFSIYSYT